MSFFIRPPSGISPEDEDFKCFVTPKRVQWEDQTQDPDARVFVAARDSLPPHSVRRGAPRKLLTDLPRPLTLAKDGASSFKGFHRPPRLAPPFQDITCFAKEIEKAPDFDEMKAKGQQLKEKYLDMSVDPAKMAQLLLKKKEREAIDQIEMQIEWLKRSLHSSGSTQAGDETEKIVAASIELYKKAIRLRFNPDLIDFEISAKELYDILKFTKDKKAEVDQYFRGNPDEEIDYNGRKFTLEKNKTYKANEYNLARTVRIYRDGKVLILFNKQNNPNLQTQDRIVGKGSFGIAKYAFDLTEEKIYVTVVNVNDQDKGKDKGYFHAPDAFRFSREFRDVGVQRIIHLSPFESKKIRMNKETKEAEHLRKYASVSPFYNQEMKKRLGELQSPLREQKIEFTCALLKQIAAFEKAKMVHGDLKPANIFLDDLHPVIADLSGMSPVGETPKFTSPFYQSPEYKSRVKYYLTKKDRPDPDEIEMNIRATEKIDAWAAGLILWQLFSSSTPGEGMEFPCFGEGMKSGCELRQNQRFTLFRSKQNLHPTLPDDWLGDEPEPADEKKIVWSLLRPQEAQRWSATRALGEFEKLQSGPEMS